MDGSSKFFRVKIESLEQVAAVGSGDAFLAGYVAARYQGKDPADCLRYGVACGAESVRHFGAGVIDPSANAIESKPKITTSHKQRKRLKSFALRLSDHRNTTRTVNTYRDIKREFVLRIDKEFRNRQALSNILRCMNNC